MNKAGKGTFKKGVIAFVGVALTAAFIGGTYAKYITSKNGNVEVDIAKWSVVIKDNEIPGSGDTPGDTEEFKLSFNADNVDTVPGKIAPGGTATAYVEVDLTGTEVSVDFSCEAQVGNELSGLMTVNVGTPVLEEGAMNMTLDAANKVVTVGDAAMSGVVRVPITLSWTDDGTDANDTQTGTSASTKTIPVTLTVQQHVSSN